MEDKTINRALWKIAELRGICVSAMRDPEEHPVIDAITEEAIQRVFECLSPLLDIAEAAVQHAQLNPATKAWLGDEIGVFARD